MLIGFGRSRDRHSDQHQHPSYEGVGDDYGAIIDSPFVFTTDPVRYENRGD